MESNEKIFCGLCLNIVSDGNFKVIEETIKKVLETLLLKLNDEENINNAICTACSVKLFAAYKFKSTCLETEDSIVPYVNSENGVPIDLRKIYGKEENKEHLRTILEDRRICRLCMQTVSYGFTLVKDIEMDGISKYIPEINFNYTKEPIICSVCSDSLNTHSTFLSNYLDLQEKTNYISDDKTTVSPLYIKPEEIDIKLENNDDSEIPLFNEYEPIDNKAMDEDCLKSLPPKQEFDEDPLDVPVYSDCTCNFETTCPKHFIPDHDIDKDLSKAQMYRCDTCDYKSNRRSTLLRHQLVHKDPSEVQAYTCDTCDYKTKLKYNLTRHQLKHKNIFELQMYKCSICDYDTKDKDDLISHRLTHKGQSRAQTYTCDTCDLKVKHKSNFLRHQKKHKDISEVQVYSCNSCDFKSKYKDSLMSHELRHKDLCNTQLYKCDQCSYQTKIKSNLTKHHLSHIDVRQRQMYKCKLCHFETRHRSSLARHKIKHKNVSEVRMHKCDACNYETKLRDNLVAHQLRHKVSQMKLGIKNQLRHKDVSKVTYKCDMCDYKTKLKRNLSRHCATHKNLFEAVTSDEETKHG